MRAPLIMRLSDGQSLMSLRREGEKKGGREGSSDTDLQSQPYAVDCKGLCIELPESAWYT